MDPWAEKLETWIGKFLVGSVMSLYNPVAWFWAGVWFMIGTLIF